MGAQPALTLTMVTKRYGPTVALDQASFSCDRGEVHALIGENGAGKSTIVRILSGLVRPDSGELFVDGERLRRHTPRGAISSGIATAFQELTLVRYLSVAHNLLVGREPRGRLRLVSDRRLFAKASAILHEWQVADDIEPESPVAELTLASQQRLEIVRALSRDPRILLLDEPTAALGASEVDWLYRQVDRVREHGTTVVFISHRLGEVRALCDRVTVLRNGHEVATLPARQATDADVVQMMLGRTASEKYAGVARQRVLDGPVALEADHVSSAPLLRDASFSLFSGEIVGVAGLQGHGQRELFLSLFGAQRITGGRVKVGGRDALFRSPSDAIRAGLGVSLVPEDRKVEGVMLKMSGIHNMTLASLDRFSRFGFLSRRRQRAAVAEVLKRLDVDLKVLDDDVASLSGGNQQKIAIGKWILAGGHVLLMYDPTRGVDVGTKAEIFLLMGQLAAEGRAILFYSTEVEELVNACDRILVFYRGAIVSELAGEDCNEAAVLAAMVGGAMEVPA